MRKPIVTLIAAVVAAVLVWAIFFRGPGAKGPNLLLITLDTTRPDHLGCYGYAKARTTALDALAASGVKFTRARSNVPLTLPSHATMMTGLYPPEHGCRVNGAHALGEGLTTLAQEFASRGYQTAAFVAAFVLDSKFGLNRGFTTYDQYEVPDPKAMDSENAMYRYRRGDKVADAALSWLGNRSRRRPFFCWVHFFDPHRPYYVPASIASAGVKQAYDFEVSFMDSQIARIIDRLRGDKLLDDTVIIALGDHGEGLGEHGEDEHGLLLYDSVMRVPLIISFPKRLPAGTETDTLVSIVDLFPTVMEIFGWRHKGRLSGKSFAAALSGGAVQGRDFYSETEFPLTEYGWSPLRSVTTEGWKYIAAPREELYDLPADPPEKKDLATEQPEKVRGMKARLAALEGAMVKKESSQVAMDEASRKVLESLGYLSGGGKKKGETASLRDPKDAVWMRTEFINAIDELNRGKTSEGEAMLRKLIKESPESYAFRYKLAKTMYDQGRFTEALPEFEEMAKMDPESFGSHYNLGKALNKLGQYARAAEELRAALTFEAKNTDGLNNLGIALLGAGKTQEAIDTFRQSISIKPDQCDPHNNLGNALLKLGKTDEALEEFRKAVKVDPNFFEGRFNVGLILLNQGDFAGAAAEFQHAVRLRPGFAEAHRYLGIALTKSGRAAEGLREFAAAEQLKGGGRPAHQ